MSFVNYYRILETDYSATPQEIKRAYRRLAKRYHPDKNPGQEKSAERRFRLITIAYETLGNTQQKLKYDLTLKTRVQERRIRSPNLDYLRNSNEIRHKYSLMFHEFLNRNIEAGIAIYEQLQRENKKSRIDDFFDYEDSRDCEFLIAEAYQVLGSYRCAMPLYESLIQYEKRRPCFHHFIDEIKERLKKIYVDILTNPENLEDIPNDLEKIRALGLSKRETAWTYKRLAERYISINWISLAKELLTMASDLDPHMVGAKKICEQLGMEHLLARKPNKP